VREVYGIVKASSMLGSSCYSHFMVLIWFRKEISYMLTKHFCGKWEEGTEEIM